MQTWWQREMIQLPFWGKLGLFSGGKCYQLKTHILISYYKDCVINQPGFNGMSLAAKCYSPWKLTWHWKIPMLHLQLQMVDFPYESLPESFEVEVPQGPSACQWELTWLTIVWVKSSQNSWICDWPRCLEKWAKQILPKLVVWWWFTMVESKKST